jgi:hypothetical protein
MEMCKFSMKIGIFHNRIREMRFHLIASDDKCFLFVLFIEVFLILLKSFFLLFLFPWSVFPKRYLFTFSVYRIYLREHKNKYRKDDFSLNFKHISKIGDTRTNPCHIISSYFLLMTHIERFNLIFTRSYGCFLLFYCSEKLNFKSKTHAINHN